MPRRRSVADHDPVRQMTTIARHVDASSWLPCSSRKAFCLVNEHPGRVCETRMPGTPSPARVAARWPWSPSQSPRPFPPCRCPVSKRCDMPIFSAAAPLSPLLRYPDCNAPSAATQGYLTFDIYESTPALCPLFQVLYASVRVRAYVRASVCACVRVRALCPLIYAY